MFGFFAILFAIELAYGINKRLPDLPTVGRTFVFILMIIVYVLGLLGYVFVYIAYQQTAVIVLVSISAVVAVVCFVFAIISKNAAVFPVSLLFFLTGLHLVFSVNFSYNNGSQFSFKQP